MASTLDIQRALLARGFDPGPLDGIVGRRTLTALRAFQLARGLTPDAVVGSKTAAMLFQLEPTSSANILGSTSTVPPHLFIAEQKRGLKEVSGSGSNPAILNLADNQAAWVREFYRADDIPWCGLFVGYCLAEAYPDEALPGNPLSALAWGGWGKALAAPGYGCVVVFRREGGGHVGFYLGEDATCIHVLGGNQSNSINVARVPKSRLVANPYRWMATVALPAKLGPISRTTTDTAVSLNEA